MRKTSDLVQKGGFFEKAGSIVILVVLRKEKKVLFEDLVTLSSVSRSTVALRTKEFQGLGWIVKHEKGRNSEYELTKEGKKIADKAIELIEEAIVNSDKKIQVNILNSLIEKINNALQDFKSVVSVVEELSENETKILEGKFENLPRLMSIKLETLEVDLMSLQSVAKSLNKEIKEVKSEVEERAEIIDKVPNFKNALDTRYRKAQNYLDECISIARNLQTK